MMVGIPKENWRDERRVALTPAGVYSLRKAGHAIVVQSQAGIGSGFSDEAFREAGGTIVFSPEEVFVRADMVVKMMPPTVEECDWIPERKILFSALQLGVANPVVHDMLRARQAFAVGFELIEDEAHDLPVVTAMSEIAGTLLPQIAGRFLETSHGGRGVTLGGVTGIPASSVAIIGAGTVGSTCAQVFLGCGANVIAMDTNLKQLRLLEKHLARMINTALATPYNIERYLTKADVVVSAVLVHGRKPPQVVTEAVVKKMRPGSVILDISIDSGGSVETSRPTTLSDPVFKKHGITHYCVPNIPSSVARTASLALNNVLLSFVEEVGEKGVEAFRGNPALHNGVYLYGGQCTHEGVARFHDWDFADLRSLPE